MARNTEGAEPLTAVDVGACPEGKPVRVLFVQIVTLFRERIRFIVCDILAHVKEAIVNEQFVLYGDFVNGFRASGANERRSTDLERNEVTVFTRESVPESEQACED